jgi:hypothetical protein
MSSRTTRGGMGPQPAPPFANLHRIAKGALAGCENMHQYAEREQIASRVTAVIDQLPRPDMNYGHPCVPHQMEFLGPLVPGQFLTRGADTHAQGQCPRGSSVFSRRPASSALKASHSQICYVQQHDSGQEARLSPPSFHSGGSPARKRRVGRAAPLGSCRQSQPPPRTAVSNRQVAT